MRLRCPLCGVGEMFAGWFRMNERCRGCNFAFERESGYFLGSIYINYGAAVVLALVLHLLMQYAWHVAIEAQLVVLVALTAAFGLFFFRWARALWLAFDLSVDPPEPQEFERPAGTR